VLRTLPLPTAGAAKLVLAIAPKSGINFLKSIAKKCLSELINLFEFLLFLHQSHIKGSNFKLNYQIFT
jgi:hypothetical protein